MDDVQKLFKKSNDLIDWISEIWAEGRWDKRLLLLLVLLAAFANPLILSSVPFDLIAKIAKQAYYPIIYYSLLAFLFISALALNINRRRKQRDSLTFDPDQSSAIKGLRAFVPADADIFKHLQRNADIRRCYDIVTDPSFRFGIIYGESGCGKSSFLHAGLYPAFKQVTAKPERESCLAVYIKLTNTAPEQTIRCAVAEQLNLRDDAADLTSLLANACKQAQCSLLLIFDQFEQFFLHYPHKQEREPFVQLLAAWHRDLPTLKMLLAIRNDYYYKTDEIQKALNYSANPQEIFELEKFNSEQASSIFQYVAQTSQLQCDETFVKTFCQQELASADGLVSPVDIQILAWVVAGLNLEGRKGFTEAIFQKAGGIEGLLASFLERTIKALVSEDKRKAAIKVLLALIDKETGLRSGALNHFELHERLPDLSFALIKELLVWLSGNKVRLLTVQEDAQAIRYELSHEKLVPAIQRLASIELQSFDKANLLLEKRVNEWLGNQKAGRYLLRFSEWRLITKEKSRILWGQRKNEKQALLKASKRYWQMQFGGIVVLSSLLLGAWIWWQLPQGQIFECRNKLEKFAEQASDEGLRDAAMDWLGLDDDLPPAPQHLDLIKTMLVDNIHSEGSKTSVFQSLAEAAVSLGDHDKALEFLVLAKAAAGQRENDINKIATLGFLAKVAAKLDNHENVLEFLEQVKKVAEAMRDEHSAQLLQSLAEVATELGDRERALDFLGQLITPAEKMESEWNKAKVLRSLAEAAAKFGDSAKALDFLNQAKKAAEQMESEWNKANVLQSLAEAAANFSDKENSLQFLEQVKADVEPMGNGETKARAFQSLAVSAAELGDHENGLKYLRSAKMVTESMQDKRSKTELFQSLAETAVRVGDNEGAFKFLELAKIAAEQIESELNKVKALQSLVEVVAELNDHENALELLGQIKTAAEPMRDEGNKVNVFKSLAEAIGGLGDQVNALEFLKQLKTAAEPIRNKRSKTEMFHSLIEAAAKLGDHENALVFLGQVKVAIVQMGDNYHKAPLLQSLAEATAKLGDNENALKSLRQVITITESMTSERFKAQAFQSLAAAAMKLGAPGDALEFLGQLRMASEFVDEHSKAKVFESLIEAAANLSDHEKVLQFLGQVKTAAESIEDEVIRSKVFESLIEAAAKLGDRDNVMEFLGQVKTVVEQMENEGSKVDLLESLTEAVGVGVEEQDDQANALEFLRQVKMTAKSIKIEQSKVKVFKSLVQVAAKLSDHERILEFLEEAREIAGVIRTESYKVELLQSLVETGAKLHHEKAFLFFRQVTTYAEQITNENDKADLLQALAKAGETLGDQAKVLELLGQVKRVAEQIRNETYKVAVLRSVINVAEKLSMRQFALQSIASVEQTLKQVNKYDLEVFLTSAKLHAEQGEYRYACHLASENKQVSADDAVQILAVVMREYGLRNDYLFSSADKLLRESLIEFDF